MRSYREKDKRVTDAPRVSALLSLKCFLVGVIAGVHLQRVDIH